MTERRAAPVITTLGYVATDTELHTLVSLAEFNPTAWEAICEWCRTHDIDPKRVPMLNHIVRDEAGYRVEYDEFEVDEDGRIVCDLAGAPIVRRVVSQGEGPPLSFPRLLERRAS